MSIAQDFKALFNSSFVSTRDSDEILLDIKSEMLNHNNVTAIFEELTDSIYKGRKEKITRAIFEKLDNGANIEDVFLEHGIIQKEEYVILRRASSTKEGIDYILSFRQEGSKYGYFMNKIFLPLYLFIGAGLLTLIFSVPILKNFLNTEVAPLISMKRGFTAEFNLPSFFNDETQLYMAFAFYIMILATYLFYFYYNKNTNLGVIYKVATIYFYDDFIKYFTIASSMKKTGANADQIFEDLSHQVEKGLIPFFSDLFERGSNFYITLEAFKAPTRIVNLLRRNEDSSKFWEQLDTAIIYAKLLRDNKIEFYIKYFSQILFFTGFLFFMGCIALPIVYFILNIYAFAM